MAAGELDERLGCAICFETVVPEPVPLSHCCGRTVCRPCLETMLDQTSSTCCFCRTRLRGWIRKAGSALALVDKQLAAIASKRLKAALAPIDVDGNEPDNAVGSDDHQPSKSDNDDSERVSRRRLADAAKDGELRAWFYEERKKAAAEARREQVGKEMASITRTIASATVGSGSVLSETELSQLRSQLSALQRELDGLDGAHIIDVSDGDGNDDDEGGDVQLLSAPVSGASGLPLSSSAFNSSSSCSASGLSGFAAFQYTAAAKRRRLMQTKMLAFPLRKTRPEDFHGWESQDEEEGGDDDVGDEDDAVVIGVDHHGDASTHARVNASGPGRPASSSSSSSLAGLSSIVSAANSGSASSASSAQPAADISAFLRPVSSSSMHNKLRPPCDSVGKSAALSDCASSSSNSRSGSTATTVTAEIDLLDTDEDVDGSSSPDGSAVAQSKSGLLSSVPAPIDDVDALDDDCNHEVSIIDIGTLSAAAAGMQPPSSLKAAGVSGSSSDASAAKTAQGLMSLMLKRRAGGTDASTSTLNSSIVDPSSSSSSSSSSAAKLDESYGTVVAESRLAHTESSPLNVSASSSNSSDVLDISSISAVAVDGAPRRGVAREDKDDADALIIEDEDGVHANTSSSAAGLTESAMATKRSSSSSTAAAASSSSASAAWHCAACTLRNPSARLICAACGATKYQRPASLNPWAAAAAAAAASGTAVAGPRAR